MCYNVPMITREKRARLERRREQLLDVLRHLPNPNPALGSRRDPRRAGRALPVKRDCAAAAGGGPTGDGHWAGCGRRGRPYA